MSYALSRSLARECPALAVSWYALSIGICSFHWQHCRYVLAGKENYFRRGFSMAGNLSLYLWKCPHTCFHKSIFSLWQELGICPRKKNDNDSDDNEMMITNTTTPKKTNQTMQKPSGNNPKQSETNLKVMRIQSTNSQTSIWKVAFFFLQRPSEGMNMYNLQKITDFANSKN